MVFDLFPKLAALSQFSDEEIAAIGAFVANKDENPLPDGLADKVKAANDSLATEAYLKNDPDFVQSIKNDRMGKTMAGIENTNKEDWLTLFGDALDKATVEAIYSNPELKKSTEKEANMRRMIKGYFNTEREKLEKQKAEMMARGDAEKNKILADQSAEIETLKALVAAHPEALEAVRLEERERYELKEVQAEVFSRIDQIREAKGGFVSSSDGYLRSLKKNAFADLTDRFKLGLDDTRNVGLFDRKTGMHAIDTEQKTLIKFEDVVNAWLLEYGAIPQNNGQKATKPDAKKMLNGGALTTDKQAKSDMPDGVNPNSERGKRLAKLSGLV